MSKDTPSIDAHDYPARYYVDLIVNNFPHRGGWFNNLHMRVIRIDGWESIAESGAEPYGIVHNMSDYYTREQADRLKTWIEDRHGPLVVKATVEEADVASIVNHEGVCLPVSAMPTGSENDFYQFSKEDGYDLPFTAQGAYWPYAGDAVHRPDKAVHQDIAKVEKALRALTDNLKERGVRDRAFWHLADLTANLETYRGRIEEAMQHIYDKGCICDGFDILDCPTCGCGEPTLLHVTVSGEVAGEIDRRGAV